MSWFKHTPKKKCISILFVVRREGFSPLFYFLYVRVLSACIFVHHMHAVPVESEGIGAPRNWSSIMWVMGIEPWFFKSNKCSNCWAIWFCLLLTFLLLAVSPVPSLFCFGLSSKVSLYSPGCLWTQRSAWLFCVHAHTHTHIHTTFNCM